MNERFKALGHLPAGEMNKTEAEYKGILQARLLAKEVIWYGFQVQKFFIGSTPDGKQMWYSPDFTVQLADRTLEQHEVKGAFITEDAAVKLVACAQMYPQYKWMRAQKTKLGWEFKTICA